MRDAVLVEQVDEDLIAQARAILAHRGHDRGLKYCGGCNPATTAARRPAALPSRRLPALAPARPGETCGALVVLCGCSAPLRRYFRPLAAEEILWVCSEADAAAAAVRLAAIETRCVKKCRPAGRHFFTIHYHYSLFTRNQGASLEPCPICAPHFFFSLQKKKKRAAPGAKEKEGLGCRRRWTRAPTRWLCAMWQAYASWCRLERLVRLFPLPLPRCLQKLCRVLQAPGQRQRSATLKQVKFVPNSTELPPRTSASNRSTVLAKFAPQPSSSPPPCTALLFFSARRRRGGGCISDKPASHCLVSKKVKSEE